jgi:flagellar basal-body rod modification protein FlgD
MAIIAGTTALANNSAVGTDTKTIANNFMQFLQLLTTQLKNQNPLDPLDTNQFTQQLVQFAQVEQQLKSNDQLATLVALQKSTLSSQALDFVGKMVVIDGYTAPMTDKKASWSLDVPKVSTVTVTIKNEAGETVYSNTSTMAPGAQRFVWDGKSTDGTQNPDGNYTISVVAKDANGVSLAVPCEVEAYVDSADLTKDPPMLKIAGKDYTLDMIKRIIRDRS